MINHRRILTGVLLVAGALFYAFAGACGAIGMLVNRAGAYLLGSAGSCLLATTAFVVGALLLLPRGTVRRLFTGRRKQRSTVDIETPIIVVVTSENAVEFAEALAAGDIQRVMAAGRQLHEQRAQAQAPQRRPVAAASIVSAAARRLNEVRTALKELGYHKNEYEPVVETMDPATPFETLVRSALAALQKN